MAKLASLLVFTFVTMLAVVSGSSLTTQYESLLSRTSAVQIVMNFIRSEPSKSEEIFDVISEYISEDQKNTMRNIMTDLSTDAFADDSLDCRACTAFVSALRFILGRNDFVDLIQPLIQICHVLFNDVDDPIRREEICNGSIIIQGPHVAYVISSNITEERICEFQNSCNLPPLGEKSKFDENEHDDLRSNKLDTNKASRSESVVTRKLTSGHTNKAELMKKKAESLKIVQLTDIHIDIRYKEGTLADCGLPICCLETFEAGDAGYYGDYNCNIPPRTIELFLQKIASDFNPDLILYTGDISGSRVWDESLDEILNCTLSLTESISRILPGHVVYPAMGNHEMYPTNLLYPGLEDVVILLNKLTDWWGPIAGFTPDQESTYRTAAYYSMRDPVTGLRIISYNSQYMYTNNWYNVMNYDWRSEAADMISYIESELAKARNIGEKVILVGHHPPNSGDYIASFANWYKSIILQYWDIIILQLSGHRHNDNFHLVHDIEGSPVSMLYLGPAVTAGGTKNPAMRLFYVDPVSHEIVDYEQYYLNMKPSPVEGSAEIELLYSARDEYSMSDLSPKSWSELVDRMELNETLFMIHYNHYSINSRENLQCSASCKAQYLCNLRHITWQESVNCTEGYSPPNNTITTTFTPEVNGSASHYYSSLILRVSFVILHSMFYG